MSGLADMSRNGSRRNVWKSRRRDVGQNAYPPVCLDILKRLAVSPVPMTIESRTISAVYNSLQMVSGVVSESLSQPSVNTIMRSFVFGC